MTFPVYVGFGPVRLHPHLVFDVLAYFLGFRLYLRLRYRVGDVLESGARWWIVAAAIGGAALGSRVLFWLEDPAETLANWRNIVFLLGGKTVVGALVGGTVAVELTKRWLGITRRTGDLFALPLALGIAVGRVGCFLSGLPDRTHGTPSALPWAVDFGDGVTRHPTQLYEAGGLLLLAGALAWLGSRPHPEGALFRLFMAGYLGLRVGVDALKPEVRLALGLSILQWAALAVVIWYARDLIRWAMESHHDRARSTV